MSTQLRKLQLCILDIALEFQRICDKYNINYFLIGGTLLGAVRHGGFIPWDDDMDIGMLRQDYDKFLEVCKNELSDGFFLQTYQSDVAYGFEYSKIRINGTLFVEDYAEHSKQHNGIFLDIFPYDVMPDNKFLQKIHYILYKGTRWAALGKSDYEFHESKKKVFAKLMQYLFFPCSKKTLCSLETTVCRMFESSDSQNFINLGGAYNYNEYTRKQNLLKLSEMTFEGYQFKVPFGYDELLKHMYGDYMKLPPVEKRGIQHNILQLDFGTYTVKNSASLHS